MGSFEPEVVAVAAAVAVAAGLVRGTTGFGGAMVMSPPLALLLGPVVAVPVVLLLEGLAALPMVAGAHRIVRWPVIGPITLMACLTVPLGTWALVAVDPGIMRRVIAATVIVFAFALLRGWRHSGRHRPATGLALGALSGTMVGATSMGGPPVILYLLSGPDPVESTRANLTVFICAISLAGLAGLWAGGVLTAAGAGLAALLAPGYYGGILLGARVFPRLGDRRFRQLVLVLLVAVSAGILLA